MTDGLHPWLKAELAAILDTQPTPTELAPDDNRRCWDRWQEGLTRRITLPAALPVVRLLLVLDSLTGLHTASFVLWLFAQGIAPLYTPLGGSWLNMAVSIRRILQRRAPDGQHPQTPRSRHAEGSGPQHAHEAERAAGKPARPARRYSE